MVPPKLRNANPVRNRNGQKRSHDPVKESKSKRRRREESSVSSEDEIEDLESLEFLNTMKSFFQKACKLYKMTRLYKVVGVDNFTRYERRLTLALHEKCAYQSNKKDWTYQVNMKRYHHVKRRDEDGETIYFEVCRRCLEDREENDEWNVILRGLVTCRNSKRKLSSNSSVSNSPVLLIAGPETVFSSIRAELEEIFSCYIISLKTLSSLNLKIIFGRWIIYCINNDLLRHNTKVDIEFCVNSRGKLITYEGSIPIWHFENAIKLDASSSANISTMWYNIFESLDKSSIGTGFHTSVSKIKSPTMRVAKEGVIRAKVNTEDILFELLESLTWLVESGVSSKTDDVTS
ncbi:unnamed protein product [Allacma fusca]|uniref:Centromere protein L n=1 Tax=Allacma fusca TaxID=39272 RepID=A0A8J2PDA8_9HEXA|nr:unnamed protein product [Allacma fusca]